MPCGQSSRTKAEGQVDQGEGDAVPALGPGGTEGFAELAEGAEDAPGGRAGGAAAVGIARERGGAPLLEALDGTLSNNWGGDRTMDVYNVHERLLTAKAGEVGALVDSLSGGAADRLWPHGAWPALELDGPLAPGAAGGHGPIRYTVTAHVPGVWVRFTFTGPRGFHGFHEFAVLPVDADRTVLRHTLAMRTTGRARLTWPLIWRPLHDALIEDSLDRAERPTRRARWTPYVRTLRALARKAR